jgi:glycerol uptake operon antiterminator
MPVMTKDERKQRLAALLDNTHVIPAVRNRESLASAISAPGQIVYFLCGTPDSIPGMVEEVVASGKVPMVNLDLIGGFARDAIAIAYLARQRVQGIISIHHEPLQAARSLGLFAIKRTFLLDSGALQNTVRALEQFLPDALEVMPALVSPRILPKLQEMRREVPVLGAGLVQSLREVECLVNQGIRAVSTSDPALWVA